MYSVDPTGRLLALLWQAPKLLWESRCRFALASLGVVAFHASLVVSQVGMMPGLPEPALQSEFEKMMHVLRYAVRMATPVD